MGYIIKWTVCKKNHVLKPPGLFLQASIISFFITCPRASYSLNLLACMNICFSSENLPPSLWTNLLRPFQWGVCLTGNGNKQKGVAPGFDWQEGDSYLTGTGGATWSPVKGDALLKGCGLQNLGGMKRAENFVSIKEEYLQFWLQKICKFGFLLKKIEKFGIVIAKSASCMGKIKYIIGAIEHCQR